MVLWRPTITSRTNIQSRCFHYRGLQYKSRKSIDTWNNGKNWPWSTEWSRARLTEFCQENTLVIENTLFQQNKRRLYTWTSPDGQCRNQIDYILCNHEWRSSIQSAKKRLGADCGSDHELLMPCYAKSLQLCPTLCDLMYSSPAQLWAAAPDSSPAQQAPLSTGFSRQALYQIQTLIEENRESYLDHSGMT